MANKNNIAKKLNLSVLKKFNFAKFKKFKGVQIVSKIAIYFVLIIVIIIFFNVIPFSSLMFIFIIFPLSFVKFKYILSKERKNRNIFYNTFCNASLFLFLQYNINI